MYDFVAFISVNKQTPAYTYTPQVCFYFLSNFCSFLGESYKSFNIYKIKQIVKQCTKMSHSNLIQNYMQSKLLKTSIICRSTSICIVLLHTILCQYTRLNIIDLKLSL